MWSNVTPTLWCIERSGGDVPGATPGMCLDGESVSPTVRLVGQTRDAERGLSSWEVQSDPGATMMFSGTKYVTLGHGGTK